MEETKTDNGVQTREKTGGSMKDDYYTTTFSIPIWMGNMLKDEAEEKGYRGMNQVVIIACTNHFLQKEIREKHNKLVNELLERGSITPKEKEALWRG